MAAVGALPETHRPVLDLYSRFKERVQADRYFLERDWYRNILFFLGIQWITYTPLNRRWMPRPLKRWIPRPVTNKFATHATTIIQVLSAKPPVATARASTNSADDLATADLANQAVPVLYEEGDADEARRISAAWVTLTGNAIIHTCYDADAKYGTNLIPDMLCPNCQKVAPIDEAQTGACPDCGAQMVPKMDAKGKPAGQQIPKGKLRIEVFSPFETYVDPESRSMKEVNEILIRRRYHIDVINGRWPQKDGTKVEPDDGGDKTYGSTGLNLLRGIAYAAGFGITSGFGSGAAHDHNQSATVDFLWKRPSEEFPNGLAAVFCNEKLLNEDDLDIPYLNKDGSPRWTFHHIGFDKVPGRFWYRTPLDDVAPKQEQRNKLESLIQLIIARSANPVWLRPKNLGIAELTGEPGQDIEYNFIPGAPKPERIPGENVPTSLIAWLEKIDADMEELAGTFEVLKGNVPSGVTAGTALRLLLERAITRFTPILQNIEIAWGDITADLIAIFQQFGTDERVAQIQGPGKTWERKAFKGSDLTGAVDIAVEAGSAVPKNSVGTQALIQDMTTMGVIMPTEPETQYQILQEFGMTKLLGAIDDNIKQAERENWDFQMENIPLVINPVIDNHMVHKLRHTQLALTSEFKTWPPEKQGALIQHILEHDMYMAGAMGAGPGAPVPAGGAPAGEGAPPGAAGSSVPPPPDGNRTPMEGEAPETTQDASMPPAPAY